MKRDDFQNPSLGAFIAGLQGRIAVDGKKMSDNRLYKEAHITRPTYVSLKKG